MCVCVEEQAPAINLSRLPALATLLENRQTCRQAPARPGDCLRGEHFGGAHPRACPSPASSVSVRLCRYVAVLCWFSCRTVLGTLDSDNGISNNRRRALSHFRRGYRLRMRHKSFHKRAPIQALLARHRIAARLGF